MKVMIFDVGGTEIKYSVMDDAMNRYESGSIPTPSDSQPHFLETLAQLYRPHRDEVDGIALSLPGFIDAEHGVVRGGGAPSIIYNIGTPVGPRLGSKVLEAKNIRKCFGDRVLIDDLSFSLPRNGIVGVIGPNGVGKTTLFKTIVGLEELTGGSLEVGESVSISYVDQNRSGIDPQKKVWEVVGDGYDFIKVGEQEFQTRAYVASFGFKGSDQQKFAGMLSGGERNRLNLALTLKQGGNLLLLDEPTNDLDTETLESLEEALLHALALAELEVFHLQDDAHAPQSERLDDIGALADARQHGIQLLAAFHLHLHLDGTGFVFADL